MSNESTRRTMLAGTAAAALASPRNSDGLAADLLWGCPAIAQVLFGNTDKQSCRKVYHLHEKGRIPTWRRRDRNGDEQGPIMSKRSLLEDAFRAPEEISESQ
jgi:hypothetical protein